MSQWSGTLTIQASLLAEKANLAVRVTADQADNDSLLLTPLKPVDAAELDSRVLLLERREHSQLFYSIR
jgi:hypothetical protein